MWEQKIVQISFVSSEYLKHILLALTHIRGFYQVLQS